MKRRTKNPFDVYQNFSCLSELALVLVDIKRVFRLPKLQLPLGISSSTNSHFSIGAESGITFYVSPDGQDTESCGDQNNKCQTIDYALKKAVCANITLILGASFTKSIVYPVEASVSLDRSDFCLRITKENPEETNPTIYGNVRPFLQFKNAVDVFIDGVNLHDVELIDSA